MEQTGDVAVTLESVHVYPVKSCAGTTPAEALVDETGFDLDRHWMVTDPDFTFVSERELPRMALVQPTLKGEELILRAPGMLALHVAVDRVEERCSAQVWRDRLEAWDMGPLCAQWFSDFLGRPLRLVRFDPEVRRLADRAWTGTIESPVAFQDGYPFLVTSAASLAEVNRRIALLGEPAAVMARFRPSIVIDGVDAHGEDHLDEIVFDTGEGPVRIKLVKPCGRCPIPDVDPATGITGHAVGDVLQQYRADRRLNGALTFGMNAVIVEGFGLHLRPGLAGSATYAFD